MTTEPGLDNIAANGAQVEAKWPEGLLGELKKFHLEAAPRPIPEVAEAGAIGYMAGLCGRAYNISGTGLNQYILMLAETGFGKEAISSVTSKLNAAISNGGNISAENYVGPTELVSAAGLYKWLARKPAARVIINEVGKMMGQMQSATNHLAGLNRALLQLYTKSGHGETFGAQAYSKKEEVIEAIKSPALTFIGESVPSSFFKVVDEAAAKDGSLPRFLAWEYTGKRAYQNKQAAHAMPSDEFRTKLSNLATHCVTTEGQNKVINIGLTPEADAKFDEFDKWTTDTINVAHAAGDQSLAVEFWGRAHLKALKLAGLAAVGVNWVKPVMTVEQAMWATELVDRQTRHMIARFASGDVGEEGGNESKQRAHILKAIANYFAYDMEWGNPDHLLRQHGIIRQSHIQAKVFTLPAFKHDRRGSTNAIKAMLSSMYENGELQMAEVQSMSSLLQKKCKARAYYVAEPKILEPHWPDNGAFRRVWDFVSTLSH